MTTPYSLFGPTSPPPAGFLAEICQVVDPLAALPCSSREGAGGGYQCEMVGPHTQHRIGDHTVQHALAGSLYSCEASDQGSTSIPAHSIGGF